jgi:hypothetical protein
MMSEEYPIKIIRGLLWNNDYDKQKIRNVNTIRKNPLGRVKLIEKTHRQDYRPT